MEKLIWETTIKFDKNYLNIESNFNTKVNISTKENNSIFLKFGKKPPSYKELLKKEDYKSDFLYNISSNEIIPSSNVNNFKNPSSYKPIVKIKSVDYYKDRKNKFFNNITTRNKKHLRPLNSITSTNEEINRNVNILNVSENASPQYSDNSKNDISFSNITSSTPLRPQFSLSNLSNKENFLSSNNLIESNDKIPIKNEESPDNIIKILDISPINNQSDENITSEDKRIKDIQEHIIQENKPFFLNHNKSLDSPLNTTTHNYKNYSRNEIKEIVNKFNNNNDNLVIDIPSIMKHENEINIDNVDTNFNPFESKNDFKIFSSSESSLTPTLIITSSNDGDSSQSKTQNILKNISFNDEIDILNDIKIKDKTKDKNEKDKTEKIYKANNNNNNNDNNDNENENNNTNNNKNDNINIKDKINNNNTINNVNVIINSNKSKNNDTINDYNDINEDNKENINDNNDINEDSKDNINNNNDINEDNKENINDNNDINEDNNDIINDNNVNGCKDHVDVDDDDDKPLSIYMNKKELNIVKNENFKIKTEYNINQKDNNSYDENVKKKRKYNTSRSNHTSDNKLNKTKNLMKINKSKTSTINQKKVNKTIIKNEINNTHEIDNKNDNNINIDNIDVDDVDIDNDEEYVDEDSNINQKNFNEKENKLIKYSDEERDKTFINDICYLMREKKKDWKNKAFKENKIVWALWKQNKFNCYYVGKIVNFIKRSNCYKIKFFDGSNTTVKKEDLRYFNIKEEDVMLIELDHDRDYNEEIGHDGFYIVQIIKKIKKDTYKACILIKEFDEIHNKYFLQKSEETISVHMHQFIIPQEYVKIIEEEIEIIKKEIKNEDSFNSSNNIKKVISLKKPKIENKIFEGYKFIVTVGGEDSVNQMKKILNTEDYIEQSYANKIEIQEQIKKLGGTIYNVNSFLNISKLKNKLILQNLIVIASIPSRTEKFLLGLALKLPIVSYNWIYECINAEKVLNYNEFLLSHGYSKELNSFIGSSYSPNELFNNLKFLLIGNTNFKSTYKLLITYSGGLVIPKNQFDKNPGHCHYVICSNKASSKTEKQHINKVIHLIQDFRGGFNLFHNPTKKKSISSVSRSSSFLGSERGMVEQTEEEMDITEDDFSKDVYRTTENEDELQSSYKNNIDSSPLPMSYLNNHPVVLQDEWIIQCLINQRIVNYNNYQINYFK